MDLKPDMQSAIQLEKHPAGGDVPGTGGKLLFAARQHHWQHKRKSNRATHFLPGGGRLRKHRT
jgi:hypothetical protein